MRSNFRLETIEMSKLGQGEFELCIVTKEAIGSIVVTQILSHYLNLNAFLIY